MDGDLNMISIGDREEVEVLREGCDLSNSGVWWMYRIG